MRNLGAGLHRTAVAVAVTGVGMGLAACGSGHHTTSGASTTTTAKSATHAGRTGIAQLLLATGDESGYAAGKVTRYQTLNDWVQDDTDPASARRELRAEGFVTADSQTIGGFGAVGGNFVEEFRSASGARREVAANVKLGKSSADGAKVTYFRVPGVSTARGITFFQAEEAGTNVYWAAGRCAVFLGNEAVKAREKQLSQAVVAINRRTQGMCS